MVINNYFGDPMYFHGPEWLVVPKDKEHVFLTPRAERFLLFATCCDGSTLTATQLICVP